MDSYLNKNNLKENLIDLKGRLENDYIVNKIIGFIVDKARDNNLDITKYENSYYIKKGDDPKAIFHLNVDAKRDSIRFSYDYDKDEIMAGRNINLATAGLLLSLLMANSNNDFDILLTTNNIENYQKSYSKLSQIMRNDNIINLNLRAPDVIADEFSALILSAIRLPIEREVVGYEKKTYRLTIDNLIGGHTIEDLDKVRLNSIKTIIGLMRRIKSKVDLNVLRIFGGERYDSIPNQAFIDFIIRKEYENDLINSFNLDRNEMIEKNLRYEPDMNITLSEIENSDVDPMTNSSFSHIASFVELVPTGAYAVNNQNNSLISSLNLSTVRTLLNNVNMIIVYRSLSEEYMLEMLEKTDIATKITNGEVINKLQIPKRRNKDHTLSDVFSKVYYEEYDRALEIIKTQYSIDSSVIFYNLNVKMISLGVEYKQGEDNIYYTKLEDLLSITNLLDKVLSNL